MSTDTQDEDFAQAEEAAKAKRAEATKAADAVTGAKAVVAAAEAALAAATAASNQVAVNSASVELASAKNTLLAAELQAQIAQTEATEAEKALSASLKPGAAAGTPGDADENESDGLDFADDPIIPDKKSELALGDRYDPRPIEDGARRWIAYALIGIFGATILSIICLVYTTSIAVTEIKEFSVLLGPLVALVSAATGFYYGTKSNVT